MSIAVMSRLFRAQLGSPNRKMLAIRLADFADDDGRGIWPTVGRLAIETELSERTVQRLLREFVEDGLLVVVAEGGGRPGQATRYDFNMRVLEQFIGAKTTSNGCHGDTGDTVSPVSTATETGDNGDREGCHRVTQTVIEPLNKPSIERGAREDDFQESGANPEKLLPEENPKTAAFEKRVMRFCSGVGYVGGPWVGWDTGKTAKFSWVMARFAELTPAERAEAELWRCPYLLDIAARKVTPKPVGLFFQDRMWRALDPEILERFEAAKSKSAKTEAAKPDGWAASYGPVAMSRLFALLLQGPADAELARNPFLPRSMMAKAWPELTNFRDMQRQRSGIIFSEFWHSLGSLMEPVPQETSMLSAWRDEFKRRAWLWPAEFDRMDVVFCPKGGPDALVAFEQAIKDEAVC